MRKEFVLGWEARALVAITAVLVVFGIVSVYSASSVLVERGRTLGTTRVLDQAVGAALGGVLLLAMARLNLDKLRQYAWPAVLVTIVALAVLVAPGTQPIAPRINGARRWLNLGVSIQVSELAKLVVVVWTAMLCARKGPELRRLSKGLLPVLSIVAPITALIALQPDLSAAVAVLFLAMLVLFAAGARVGHFILLGVVALPLLWRRIEGAQYQLLRLSTFLDPGSARPADTYQLDQSLLGVGSGQLFGVGFGHGQQKLGFLPYPYSDFVFSLIAEEWGFIGVLFLVALFAAFVWLALRLARRTNDPFRQYLGIGCAGLIGADAFLHMAVGLGIVPTTGLVLPFISHGRTGLVSALMATGLIINIGTQRRAALGQVEATGQ
jgi:cell division protein FtsW